MEHSKQTDSQNSRRYDNEYLERNTSYEANGIPGGGGGGGGSNNNISLNNYNGQYWHDRYPSKKVIF